MNRYNYDMGRGYDTTFFMTLYYREDDFFTLVRNRFGEIAINEAMCGFFNFKERYKSVVLPPEIAPFAYTDYQAGLHSFLIRVICDNLDFENHTKDDIISFLQSFELKMMFWEHFFSQKDDRIAERIITNDSTLNIPEIVNKLNISEEIKLHLVAMAFDFPKYQQILIGAFAAVYAMIAEYHAENQSIIEEMKNQITENLSDRLYKIYKPSTTVQSYSFSLLNGVLVDYRGFDKKVCFVLGSHFNDVIDSLHRYSHISLNSFGKIVCVETRAEMLDMFLQYKRLCASEIADSLNITKSTIYVHLNSMLLEGMIRYTDADAKNNGERVYFSVNSDYFKVYAGLATDINEKAYNNISKGIDKYELPRKKRKARDGLIYNDNDEYNEEEMG